MRFANKYAHGLISKDKGVALSCAKHIFDTADLDAWSDFIQQSDFIFPFIKQNISEAFEKAINIDNYRIVFELFKIHSVDWDECLIKLLLNFSSEPYVAEKMADLLENGSEDEKAYASKYYTFVKDAKASYALFQAYKSSYEPLKYNAACALGCLEDSYAYEYYINKLESDDDWEKSDAAQFLNWYGNKTAFPLILKSMSKSTMSEYLAGEAAILENISKYFASENLEMRDLCLECYENLIIGLVEIWPLSAMSDFNLFECVQVLLSGLKNPPDMDIVSRYACLLIKTKILFNMLVENEQYRYDESKEVFELVFEINDLLENEGYSFWSMYESQIIPEIQQENEKRKIFAINLIRDIKSSDYTDILKVALRNKNSDKVVYNLVSVLAEVGDFNGLDKNQVQSQIVDENIKSFVDSIWTA